ncbi:DUF4291 domain-containing protein [Microbispora sp. H10885]|uniref:DUF4291 domain-containing protein n=1 Tax=Microbispora sp. H10885 TaxID=2729110 RepID=UPI0015FF5C4D|nr:DUF4291 domain-containing protein [Microbispora sp. H10885]
MEVPYRQIRAAYTEEAVTVYQAYDPAVADRAVAAQRFVPPFKRERMTWVKPSFHWMMYRSGWAAKPGQTRVLAVQVSRDGFEWALAHSCPSHPGPGEDQRTWATRLRESPVRIQWDPERDARLHPLPYRSIQIGLSGEAVDRYVDEWIVSIADITAAVGAIRAGAAAPPAERPYPLPSGLAGVIGASPDADDRAGRR